MQILDKIRRLSSAGQYDLCCEGSSNKIKSENSLLEAAKNGIYYSKTQAGICRLFKTLISSNCNHDCAYCPNSTRCSNKKTAEYTPTELANTFKALRKFDYVEGLFLSSGITKTPDETAEKMLEAVKIIRLQHKFQGYIHFKILPGTSKHLIKEASLYATRMSINIEAPSSSRLSEFSDVKNYKSDIIKRQFWIKEQQNFKKIPEGQTTQIIVGGNDTTDLEVLKMVDWEYKNIELEKIYYSGFKPVKGTPLEKQKQESMKRVFHLYNTDFLMRRYNYKFKEFREIMDKGMLPNEDPKFAIAKQDFSGAVDINEADYDELIRIPGIGPKSAKSIVKFRPEKITKKEQLVRIGVRVNQAMPFIRLNGYFQKMLGAY